MPLRPAVMWTGQKVHRLAGDSWRTTSTGARPRAVCTAALLTLSVVPGALAAPAISWTFSPDFHASGLTGAVDVRGTLLNTGAETIVGINFLQASTGTLGPYITNWAWNASFWEDYNNASGGALLDIAPGETFDFYVATLSYDNAPAGKYIAVASVATGVLSAGGVYSGSVASGNEMRVRIPEPSAAALSAVALLGCALVRRRRPMDAH